ncbi:MAG: 3-carboxyethylcatechol 2,3-dioxygenase [Pseudomonadota bacterium]
MKAIAQCLSHSPAVNLRPLDHEREQVVRGVIEDSKNALRAFDPEVVVVFGPDHYNGFFYNMMPPFCVGERAFGIGDYGTLTGALNVDAEAAHALHAYLLSKNFDAAVSYDMHIDHGFTQCLDQLFDFQPRFVPVFINCLAHPIASCARTIDFGAMVGRFFEASGKRTAFIGSGGLSHDAPLPKIDELPEDAKNRIIQWRLLTPAERAQREKRTMDAADEFAAGRSTLAKLNPEWDQKMMAQIGKGSWSELMALEDAEIALAGGRSAHEIRTWLAAYSALNAFGSYHVEQSIYLEVPEWIVGYGALRARTAVS